MDRTDLITTHMRSTFFAEWLTLWWEKRDGEGYLRLPFGEGRRAPLAAVDQSRAIAAMLLDPEPHNLRSYALYGAVEQDHHDIARELSATLGLPVHYEPISVEEFRAGLRERRFAEHTVQHLCSVAVDYRNGVFAGTNVEKITGRRPLTVEQFAARNRSGFEFSGPYFIPAS
ncbi:MAG TPA: hypothetical protein VHV74_20055 [Pseudonocardiaceae bacterium]|nr:hypothetical protein [Pseudonocardiaceae bacterium]